jgi:hypothetical protein
MAEFWSKRVAQQYHGVTMLFYCIIFTQRNVEGQITREEIRSALALLSLGLPT